MPQGGKGIDLESKNHYPSRSDCCRELAGDDHALYHHPADEDGRNKTGDKVAFNFVQQGNLSLLQDIKVSQ